MTLKTTALALFSLVWTALPAAHAGAATFFPKINMTDTAGNAIQAHGGAIIQAADHEGSWYWFGEDKTNETTFGHFIGVTCYKSADFSSWDYVGHVLKPIPNTNISSTSIVERPKVLYNNKTSEYVMWFHGDNMDYSLAQVGVATSKTIDGQYQWKGNFRPFGNDSRDMTVWQDPDDGTAYLIYATNGNADLSIARLTDDYLNVSETLYTFHGVYEEAPGVFKINGKFYLLFSPQNEWTPTNNGYYVASSMSGPWSASTLLAPDDSYTYLTQNAYDITIHGRSKTMYLYYGDHWNGNNLSASTYSFYPVIYNGSGLSLHSTGGWELDAAAGTWCDLPYKFISASSSTTPKGNLVSCDDGCQGGLTANMTASKSFTFTWNGSAGHKVLQIIYTFPGYNNQFQQIGAVVDKRAVNGTALMESTAGTNFAQMAPLPLNLRRGSKVALNLLDYDGTEFLIDGVRIYSA